MALKGNPGGQFSPTEYSTLWEDQVNSVLTTKILRHPPPPFTPSNKGPRGLVLLH